MNRRRSWRITQACNKSLPSRLKTGQHGVSQSTKAEPPRHRTTAPLINPLGTARCSKRCHKTTRSIRVSTGELAYEHPKLARLSIQQRSEAESSALIKAMSQITRSPWQTSLTANKLRLSSWRKNASPRKKRYRILWMKMIWSVAGFTTYPVLDSNTCRWRMRMTTLSKLWMRNKKTSSHLKEGAGLCSSKSLSRMQWL